MKGPVVDENEMANQQGKGPKNSFARAYKTALRRPDDVDSNMPMNVSAGLYLLRSCCWLIHEWEICYVEQKL